MIQKISTPKIFIVKGIVEGKRVTQKLDTFRNIGNSRTDRNDTCREIYRTDVFKNDTVRRVHNMNNICFDTTRKINRQEIIHNDTYREVHSNVPVYDHSFYVHSKTGKPIECVIFHNTVYFPYPNKYVKVQLDDNGEFGYLPLAPVGSEYDSGMRYTENDGTVWQICTNVIYNLIKEYFVQDNYFINATDYSYLYKAFKAIFGGRVRLTDDGIILKTPQYTCGITKMFMIGLDLRISWNDNDSDDFTNSITLTTFNDGLNDTSYKGDNKHKADAMLVKFEPRKKYKIQFYDNHNGVSYTDEEAVRGCFIFGKDVENMEEKSGSYQTLIDTQSYCTCDESTGFVINANDVENPYYSDMQDMRNQWLNYNHSRKLYNYYDLVHLKYTEKK